MGFGRRRKRGNFPETLYLERWIATQSARRAQLTNVLSSKPMTPALRAELDVWKQNLQTKKAWLKARLEHVEAVERLLNEAIDRHEKPSLL